ncbi:MAG: DoxX family protein [Burkholderiales bacterium]
MVKQYGPLVGRIFLALLFLIAGIGKITGFAGTVGYMEAYGVPMAQLLAVVTIVIEVGGGILLIVGWQTRWAATALFVFTLVVTPIFHAFWAVPADQEQLQMIMFLKNLAIMGGLLYVMAHGAGQMAMQKNG